MLSAVTQPNALHGSLFTVLIIWRAGVVAENFHNTSWMPHPSLGCRICTGDVQNPQKSRRKFNYLLSARRMSTSPYLLEYWLSKVLGVLLGYVYYSLMCSHKLVSFPMWHRRSAATTPLEISQGPEKNFDRAWNEHLNGFQISIATSSFLPHTPTYSGWVGEKPWSTKTWGLCDSESLSSASDFGRLYSPECIRI